ncbi:hypothetical protein V491_04435 [Pseudogymnoascus sp. VKM F-3775]|nr:hypothetical protein V491_04435 [Pseudogymnoascus sp. VKM F-3775]
MRDKTYRHLTTASCIGNMAKDYEDVEFKTIDGLVLRGWLFPAAKRGPAVVMTPGFNCIKEDFYPGFPQQFQKAGITVLLYDPRNTGTSSGFPRNDIDPTRQVEDYSDAHTYLATLSIVDPLRIAIWGVSFTGGTVLASAALDKRPCAVIAVAPIFYSDYITDGDRVRKKIIRDREAQILHGSPPFFISILESRGMVPVNSHIPVQSTTQSTNTTEITHNREGSTIQSYLRMALWQPVPLGLLPMVNPTPVMFLTPEHDYVSLTQVQLDIFETLKGPKRQHLALGREHVNVLMGEDMPALAKIQTDFLWQAAEGRLAGQANRTSKDQTNGELDGFLSAHQKSRAETSS